MTHTLLARSNNLVELSRGVKAGIKLDFDMLCAYTEERLLVPIEHPEAVIFAGVTITFPVSDNPASDKEYYDMLMQGALDNSDGQDGDKNGQCFLGTYGFPVASLTQPLDVSLQDRGQIIYASANRTLHKNPGKGRFPIGVYLMTAPSQGMTGKLSSELCHWIEVNGILPRFKA